MKQKLYRLIWDIATFKMTNCSQSELDHVSPEVFEDPEKLIWTIVDSYSHGSPDQGCFFRLFALKLKTNNVFNEKDFEMLSISNEDSMRANEKSARKMRLCLLFMWINSLKVDKRSDWNCRLNRLFHKATLVLVCAVMHLRENARELGKLPQFDFQSTIGNSFDKTDFQV